MTVPDLLGSEIRETILSDSLSARRFSLKLPRPLVAFCFPPEDVVKNLVLLDDCFPLGLRLDCECSSEVPLGTMVVPAMPDLINLLWHFPVELSSKPVL